MKLAKIENNTVVNVIEANSLIEDYVACPAEVGIGWTTVDNVNFEPPVETPPNLDEYRTDALSKVASFEDEQLKIIMGNSLGHKTVVSLIRFMAATAYAGGTASVGQTAFIENEATQKNVNPATLATNAANIFNAAQGTIGSLKGIIDVATTAINNATNIAEVDLAVASAIEAWNEL